MTSNKFKTGIQNAVNVCMNTQEDDRVFIFCDKETDRIGKALEEETKQTGAEVKMVYLESYGSRPLTSIPDELISELIEYKPTLTYYAAESKPGEIKMRMELTNKSRQAYDEIDHAYPRHAHMVSITPQLIEEGMNADYNEINRITYQVYDLVKNAQSISVTSAKGSDITATFNPSYRWKPCHGLYHKPTDRGNLPEGEVFTCPDQMNGIVVADILGDHFSPKYGVLENPVRITIKDSLVENVTCQDDHIAKELLDYLDSAENGRRVGEFAIGTNIAIKHLSGNLLQDEKIPGVHIAFGNPYPRETGADWSSLVHVDVIPTNCNISVDNSVLMVDGEFQF
jgi:leucyl aminopeptidase (aminopeptidase T)